MKIIAVILTSIIPINITWACSCLFEEEPLKNAVSSAYKSAAVVVLAKAVKVTNSQEHGNKSEEKSVTRYQQGFTRYQHTQFTSIQSWKGKHDTQFFTSIETTCCFCGYQFKQGEHYLLYLDGPDKKGYFTASTCSRTTPKTLETTKEIKLLNAITHKNNQ